jgi:hypothetical protein
MFEAVRMIDKVRGDRADRAQTPMVQWRLAVTLHPHQDPILDVKKHAASPMAAAADAFEDSCFFVHGVAQLGC